MGEGLMLNASAQALFWPGPSASLAAWASAPGTPGEAVRRGSSVEGEGGGLWLACLASGNPKLSNPQAFRPPETGDPAATSLDARASPRPLKTLRPILIALQFATPNTKSNAAGTTPRPPSSRLQSF